MKKISTLIITLLAIFTASAQSENDTIAYMLDEVVVKVNRSMTTMKGNSLVTRISGTSLEHAGTANDVLKQVPMVIGDNGNFEVFGKGNPAIYVNGRLIQDNSELEQLNSSNIKNVEVVTNPGAKYDAAVKAVILINTKAPQGDGFSGLLRAQVGVQRYLRTMDQANLKYRNRGLEIFANFGYLGVKVEDWNTVNYITRTSTIWNQQLEQKSIGHAHDFYGKAGFSYMFNQNHSVGAYYSNGFTFQNADYTGISTVLSNQSLYDRITMSGESDSRGLPKHHANLYYNGSVSKLGIDLNIDFMWRKNREKSSNEELSQEFPDENVSNNTISHSRLLAEKLVFSYPVWKGAVEFGEEYTNSMFSSDYTTTAAILKGADSRVDENNIAGFISLTQRFGNWNVAAGLRYEHVNFKYLENGQKRDDMTRTYNNFFPSVSVSTTLNKVQLGLSYSMKTQRPSYSSLDGSISYVNRFLLEGGNPYLQPVTFNSVQLQGAWRRFFGQISYTYSKNPIMNTSLPYEEDGEIKLLTKENFPRLQNLEVFVGAQFEVGIWQPKVNVGIIKQWLTVDYNGGKLKLNNPLGLVQWQNAIHLPADIWLNVDLQWMSRGNGENAKLSSTSYMNVKFYKAFFNNSFSVTLEANDIFNKNNRDFTFYSRDVTLYKHINSLNRTFLLTLQYTFNTTRDRYRGQGAGTNEMNRF